MDKKQTISQLQEYSVPVQANIIATLYKKPTLLYDYSDLKIEDFSENVWRVYLAIMQGLVLIEKKEVVNEYSIGVYLEKHTALADKYAEYGGYETIQNMFEAVDFKNFDAYIYELNKINALIKMTEDGFPVGENLREYKDMPLEDIYDRFEAMLNNTFIKSEGGIKVYDATENLDDLIDELDLGIMVGLPYHNMPILTDMTGGCRVGELTILAKPVNQGKSSFVRNVHVISLLEASERVVIILNEEGVKKFRMELLCYIANNIFKYNLQKHVIRNGKYSQEVKDMLKKSALWLKDKAEGKILTIIPLSNYTTAKAMKIIRKYSALGIKYFVIDTFKTDSEIKNNEKRWENLKSNAVKLYDLIKPDNKNVHLMLTYQISIADKRQRYLDMDNLGESKGVCEVADTVFMARNVFPDEIDGEGKTKNRKLVIRRENKDGLEEIVELDPKKYYQVMFIAKSRSGEAGRRQIVFEHDLSRNIVNEIGYTMVSMTDY